MNGVKGKAENVEDVAEESPASPKEELEKAAEEEQAATKPADLGNASLEPQGIVKDSEEPLTDNISERIRALRNRGKANLGSSNDASNPSTAAI